MSAGPGDFDYQAIDDVIHGRVRLAVMAFLSGAGSAEWGELKAKVGGSDGNISVHLRKLEDAGYLKVEKKFHGRKPRTILHLSETGREAWIAYIARMQSLLGQDAAE